MNKPCSDFSENVLESNGSSPYQSTTYGTRSELMLGYAKNSKENLPAVPTLFGLCNNQNPQQIYSPHQQTYSSPQQTCSGQNMDRSPSLIRVLPSIYESAQILHRESGGSMQHSVQYNSLGGLVEPLSSSWFPQSWLPQTKGGLSDILIREIGDRLTFKESVTFRRQPFGESVTFSRSTSVYINKRFH